MGKHPMGDVHARLDWAVSRHDELQRLSREWVGRGGEESPFGVTLRELPKPAGLVVARFTIDQPIPNEMRLLAADLVHNTRVALDHVLARLKDHFGGNPGHGVFPTWQTEALWQEKIVHAKRSALTGLAKPAVDLIYGEQPLHRGSPAEDPLVILNTLDGADKHRLLHPSFVHLVVEEGLDLIEILDGRKVIDAQSLWRRGEMLEHGTRLARVMIRGDMKRAIRLRSDLQFSVAAGEAGAPMTAHTAMIARVRGIADRAAALIDRSS
jgi:hypothetical protein